MDIGTQNGTASPQSLNQGQSQTTISVEITSSDTSRSRPVEVTYRATGTCARVQAPNKSATVPQATATTDGKVRVAQTVTVTGTGTRPCRAMVNVDVWNQGAVDDPAGPLSRCPVLINLL